MSVHPGSKAPTMIACLLAFGLLAGCEKSESPASPPPQAAASPTGSPATSEPVPPENNPGFAKLRGKWQRTDGGYVLDIRNILPGGKMEAQYLNPSPINVAKAEATANGSNPKVFVELRDTNYPGCTYALTYNPATDQLAGVYFQASMGQQFEVVFARLP
jgi:hypothetical protein